MDTPEKDINWEKLLSILEDGETTALNEDEAAMLRAAREMQNRVKTTDKFPAEEGWQQFVAAREARTMKVMWRRRIAIAAAAAALLVTAGVWSWQKHLSGARPSMAAVVKADLPATTKVQIVMGNGQTITLGDKDSAIRKDNNGTQVQVDSAGIVYQAGHNKKEVTTMDALVVPKGNQAHIVLPDGTEVWVNAASKLTYPSAFNSNKREVWLEGEAFLDVAANVQQPFIVHAKGTTTEVLGTSFNISTYVTVQTTLTSGKVNVSAGTANQILAPGQQATYNEAAGALQKQAVDTRLYTAWKDGDIYFEDATLGNIMTSLGRSFDYDFKFEDATLEQVNITLDIHKPTTLQPVLDRIKQTIGNINFRVEGRTVFISRP
ncbi:MAG: FecR domain-containing protein [Chitinophaga sp.]|uniref:FecR family protein n=1 Tax=Chitinophaga sp. TaxID=1869181 RepID=UPI001B25F93D|nr:FecR family protein [Chitinophaga sp.]MBO9731572.1 FecR domain-containing protein [Chitinophaga sp.]